MFRMIGIFGLGALFLFISPPLRETVMGLVDACSKFLNDHSPISYFGVGLVVLGGAVVWVYHAAQPR